VVLLTDILGTNVVDASIFLKERGLQVDAVPGEPLEAMDPRILTVYKADGLGQVPVGSVVKIYYYIQQALLPDPDETEPGAEPTETPLPTDTLTPTPTPTPTEDAGNGN
jgi:hypothetical protein